MKIVHIASELTPIAKVGGLADVVYGLSQALLSLKHDVAIFLPKYDTLDLSLLKPLKKIEKAFVLPEKNIPFSVYETAYNQLKIFLFEDQHPSQFFLRGQIYSCSDDIERFIFFSEAAIHFLKVAGFNPDIVHLHDWPVALIAPLIIKEKLPYPSVLTLHNMEHQGLASPDLLKSLGSFLNASFYDVKYPNTVNLLQSGIEYASAITTVSPSYEKEIQTPIGGQGLGPLVTRHKAKLFGILNGIDDTYYNPVTDPAILHRFSEKTYQDPACLLLEKGKNKSLLFKKYQKKENPAFTVAAITRLAKQKAPELIAYALKKTIDLGGRFILLGSLHGNHYTALFDALQNAYKEHPDALLFLNKDDALAHQIYAACDALIIPSLFEPCGLTQMIAMRYGMVPLARKTGGLADTVFDVDTSDKPVEERNGYTFDFPDEKGIDWVLERAFQRYRDRAAWGKLSHVGFKTDFSWKKSAKLYEKVYESLKARFK